jgi:ribosomal protein L9
MIENKHNLTNILNNKKLEFKLKTWTNHKVYWWIWEKDIITMIKKNYKIELSKKNITMPDWHIKKLWENQIFINLWKDSIAKMFIVIKEI